MSVQAVLEGYLTNVAHRKGIKQTASRVKKLSLHFGVCPTSEMSIHDVLQYIAHRKEDKAKPATINREVEILRAAFKMYSLPFPNVKKLPENNVRQGFFTEAEFLNLLAALPYHLKELAHFAYITGWRKSEITGLRWEHIENQGGNIVLPDTKNGRPRVIPIEGKLRSILGGLGQTRVSVSEMGHTPSPWVFHDPDGNKIRDFRRAWATACRRAGLKGKLFHDLRRTAARNMIAAGIDRQVAKAITGHLTDSMFTRYQIVDQTQVRAALEKL